MKRARNWQLQSSLRHLQLMQMQSNSYYFILRAALLCELHNRQRRRTKLSRSAIQSPKLAGWEHLLNFGNDDSFLNVTGMSRHAFMEMEKILFSTPEEQRPNGRPLSLNRRGQLGLLLFYIGSMMAEKHLCLLFGITPSCCNRFIADMMDLVKKRLRTDDRAKVEFPNEEKMEEWYQLTKAREPGMYSKVIGFMDGVQLHSSCSSEPNDQNAYYNGYGMDTFTTNVFAFSPTGKIFLAFMNFPGSWNDARVTANHTQYLQSKLFPKGFSICVDQGFKRTQEMRDILVGPINPKTAKKLSRVLRPTLLAEAARLVSLRQASEWGMRALQGSFPRLKMRLSADPAKRKALLNVVVLVSNFRTVEVGLNQIATVFNPHYENSINIEGYDRISRYYVNDLNFDD
jgi:hypothetical protein